jgi:hypothetical protein
MKWVGHVECKTREKHTRLWFGNLQKHDHFEDLGIAWRILKKTGWKGAEWVNLDPDRYKQQALAHVVITLQIPHTEENFLTV